MMDLKELTALTKQLLILPYTHGTNKLYGLPTEGLFFAVSGSLHSL